MPRRGRPRIRIHAGLRGLPGTEHLHVVVEQRHGTGIGDLTLDLVADDADDAADGAPSPWTDPPGPLVFHLDGPGDRRWVAFGVEPWPRPGERHRFTLHVTAGRVLARRRYRLEERHGHWRLRTRSRFRPGPARARAPAETSNAPAH